MKPPVCELCHNDFSSEMQHAGSGGAMVQFADYRPLGEGCAGHPHGYEWFCDEHLANAQALASLSYSDAMTVLTRQYAPFADYPPLASSDPALWITEVGPNPAKVFALIRQAMGVSPSVARDLLAGGPFKVSQAWPQQFRVWQEALIQAGTQVEIRYPSSKSAWAEKADADND
ncbi:MULTISPECIES: hypothetical protein [unclassified Pseudomonas]|uniref:hypothetical protein n=1 Tax=unclassified Pseudomonas TaxID=196821 RepID=UPI0005FC4440|nr:MULTISPECIES: hypothetical protein [unclassified Pseudomonas]ULT71924.1 hypothetical protein L1O02_06035 [Pseudomonas sp. BC42]BAQ76670.1 uncharacterized protein POS17_4976 [Pseudomonas sp. Os17]BAQ82882.1 uncharacterized protein PST29_4993 [Pseudomonas sp. St29]